MLWAICFLSAFQEYILLHLLLCKDTTKVCLPFCVMLQDTPATLCYGPCCLRPSQEIQVFRVCFVARQLLWLLGCSATSML